MASVWPAGGAGTTAGAEEPAAGLLPDSTPALECKIDGVMGSYADMVFTGGKRWKYAGTPLPTTGTYNVRVRVKTDTPDEVQYTATIA